MTIEASGWSTDAVVRVFAGVARGSQSNRLKAAILRCHGDGWNLRVLHTDAVTLPLPSGGIRELARAVCQAVVGLAGELGLELAAIDSLGLGQCLEDDIGLASEIAERTGLTVVARLEDRDRAVGGRGRPLSPVPDWILYRSSRSTRLLVHLGASVQFTLLAAGRSAADAVCFDAGPGTDFLDNLARRLSDGKHAFDPSGHFAVQGKQCEALIEQWTSHPFLLRHPPRFVDEATFNADFIESSLAFARERRLNGKDVLCSANHFIGRALRDSVDRFLPVSSPPDNVIFSGGGIRNGLLWKLASEIFDAIPIHRTDELGVPIDVRAAVHAALMGFLAMENLPGNIPAATGASAFRVLGTIIPGSQSNWDRWVCNVADRFDMDVRRAA